MTPRVRLPITKSLRNYTANKFVIFHPYIYVWSMKYDNVMISDRSPMV